MKPDVFIFPIFQGIRKDAVQHLLASKGPAAFRQVHGIPPADNLLQLTGYFLPLDIQGDGFVLAQRCPQPDSSQQFPGCILSRNFGIDPGVIDHVSQNVEMVAPGQGRQLVPLRQPPEVCIPAVPEIRHCPILHQRLILVIRDAHILQPEIPLVVGIVHPRRNRIGNDPAHNFAAIGNDGIAILLEYGIALGQIKIKFGVPHRNGCAHGPCPRRENHQHRQAHGHQNQACPPAVLFAGFLILLHRNASFALFFHSFTLANVAGLVNMPRPLLIKA